MSRAIHKLTVRRADALSKEGWHGDGGGLYLRIRADGSKRWIFVWKRGAKRNEMFLGRHGEFSLEEYRDMAKTAGQLVKQGFDPRELRKEAERLAATELLPPAHEAPTSLPSDAPEAPPAPAVTKAPTFSKFAEAYIESQEDGWRNAKHKWQWRNSITNHCASITDKSVDEITTEDVLGVLKPIWLTIQDTAARVRARIERILDAAKAGGHIASPWENPARWQGNLVHKLPKQKKRRKSHYPAIDYEELPTFFRALRARPALAARALELTILCATRTNETLGMRWHEVDFDRATWTIPGDRMKMGVEHRVPLSTDALALLRELARGSNREPDAFVFPGEKPGKSRSQMSMIMVLRRMEMGHITVHGMRSAFRDYMGDMTHHDEPIIEQALAHQVGDSTVRAYRRKDAFEKRRLVMQDWASYVAGRLQRPLSAEADQDQVEMQFAA